MTESSGNPNRTRPHRIVLVGFMGAGKTSVGRELAKFLAWDFVDLDERIERDERRTVREIFATNGEAHFRRVERKALEHVLRECQGPTVLSVGGGAFAENGAAELVSELGAVSVLLDASVEELRRRVNMGGDTRPLAKDRQRFSELYRLRSEAYAKAQHRVNTEGKSIPRVAHEIAEWAQKEFVPPAR